jgi:SsrA-binding protein
MPAPKSRKLIANNRRARHRYHVLETYEAGIVLQGTEVKAVREGKVNLGDAYAVERGGEVYLLNCHIGAYEKAAAQNHEPMRARKLLLHQREIRKLVGTIAQKGFTLVPLSLYFRGDYAKVKLGVCRGKRKGDKREVVRRREAHREISREMARRSKSRKR